MKEAKIEVDMRDENDKKLLSRDSLESGEFVRFFKGTPGLKWLSEDDIHQSMIEFLATRPINQELWLFAYGSLIWNPGISFEEKQSGIVKGWHRSFCMKLTIARGTVDMPGRMLSLLPSGSSHGLVLKLSNNNFLSELKLIWRREMVGGIYLPQWVNVNLPDGREITAITFVGNEDSAFFETDDSIDTIKKIISCASGPLGTNKEYLELLYHALKDNSLEDTYIFKLFESINNLD